MESARWPGCERITRLRDNGRIESEEEEEECARLPTPRGDPREASEDLEDLEEGDHAIAIQGGNSHRLNAPPLRSKCGELCACFVCACVCV